MHGYIYKFRTKGKTKYETFLEYFVAAEFALFAGGLRFEQTYGRFCMLLFVITSYLLYNRRRFISNVKSGNLRALACIAGWVVIANVLNPDVHDLSALSYILYPLGGYFAISASDLDTFREKLLKVVRVILAISIVVQFGVDLGYISSHSVQITDTYSTQISLFFFNTGWGINEMLGDRFHRLSSVYWEPGQCQIVIMFVLCLFSDELSHIFDRFKYVAKKFGILIVALFLTYSTTGYLAFAILLGASIVFSELGKRHEILYPVLFVGAIASVMVIWNSDAVQNKLSQAGMSEDTSYSIRMADNLGLLNMCMAKPLLGYGVSTSSYSMATNANDSRTSSNGWLNGAAQNGVPYSLFIIFFMLVNLRKRLGAPLQAIAILAALVLSQANEARLYLPYLFMYVYAFGYDDKYKPQTSEDGNCREE